RAPWRAYRLALPARARIEADIAHTEVDIVHTADSGMEAAAEDSRHPAAGRHRPAADKAAAADKAPGPGIGPEADIGPDWGIGPAPGPEAANLPSHFLPAGYPASPALRRQGP